MVNIILNIVLIPLFSLVGASIATLATNVVMLFYMAYHSNKIVRIYLKRYILKPSVAGGIMGVVLLASNLNVLISILIGVAVYFGVFLLIRGFDKEDVQLVQKYILR